MLPLEPFSFTLVAMASAAAWQPCMSTDTLLWGLERSGSNLSTFSANITFERYKDLEDEVERRYGRLVLEGQGPSRKLGCMFTLFVDTRGASKESKNHWVFADGWLGEADLRFKSFNKRRVVEPGASWDPLKLGEGPFPLPFGQPEAEVRARFTVETAQIPDNTLVATALKSDTVCGIRLTPKPNTSLAKDARFVDVFYSAKDAVESLIPRVVVFVKPNGDRSTIILYKPLMNETLSDEDQALLVMPNPDPKEWSVDIREWQSDGDADGEPEGGGIPAATDGGKGPETR
jgi:hypothetical protein